jgi:3-dehydroquinate dehydratase-2
MKILILHGPNINLIGKYSLNNITLDKINRALRKQAKALNYELTIFQFIEEGKFLRQIQRRRKTINGIIFNPGALARVCYTIKEIIEILEIPLIEIHISELPNSKTNYNSSILKTAAQKRIFDDPIPAYQKALKSFDEIIKKNNYN